MTALPSPIHVGFCVDENHAGPLCVALSSMLESDLGGRIKPVFVIDPSDQLAGLIGDVCAAYGRKPAISTATPEAAYALAGTTSTATYRRLFLAEAFPALDRLIYLDADILVRQPLDALWEATLGGLALGAVPDGWVLADAALHAAFGGRYFNSGVMLMDLGRWRAEAIGARCAAYLEDWRAGRRTQTEGGAPLAALPPLSEQTALNLVLGADWRELPAAWNFTRFMAEPLEPRLGQAPGAFRRIARDPAIVHFAGHAKPWLPEFAGIGPCHAEYAALKRRLERRFDLRGLGWRGLGWPGPADFGPVPAIQLAGRATRLVAEARRMGLRRVLVFGTTALGREVARVAAGIGLEVVGFASTSPLHYGGRIGAIPVEAWADVISGAFDGVIVGDGRLTADAARLARADLARAGLAKPVISDS
jgi:lipopolysaccharide biosynthesis glycosyltransferase